MKYATPLRAIAMLPLMLLCAACVSTAITNDVPQCDRLIPPSMLEETPPADLPVSAKLPDGHDDARPWQSGFIEQTGQLGIANARVPAVDHIYRACLQNHREALEKSRRGFFGRLFGG